MTRSIKYGLGISVVLIAAFLFLLLMTGWGLSLSLNIASALIPGELKVSHAEGRLFDEFELSGVSYNSDEIRIKVKKVDLVWQSGKLLFGELYLDKVTVEDITLEIIPTSSANEATSETVLPDIVLPISIIVNDAGITGIKIQTSGAATQTMIDSIGFAANAQKQQINIQKFNIHAYDVDAMLQGDINLKKNIVLDLSNSIHYQLEAKKHIKSNGSIDGDLANLDINQTISGLAIADLKLNIRDLIKSPGWNANLHLTEFNPGVWVDSLGAMQVNGKIQAEGDLHTAKLHSQFEVNDKTHGAGEFEISATTNLSDLSYQYKVAGQFSGVDIPELNLDLNGDGDNTQVSIAQLNARILNGTIAGVIKAQWQSELRLDGQMQLKNIDLDKVADYLPEKLNADILFKTQNQQNNTVIEFSASRINALLKKRQLTGDMNGQWNGQDVLLKNAELAVADSKINISGQLGKQSNLKFSASSPDIAQILSEAHGQINLNGELNGNISEPEVTLSGSVKKFQYAQEQFDSLSIDANLGLKKESPFNFDIQVDQLVTRAGQWKSARLASNGTSNAHSIQLNMNGGDNQFKVNLDGHIKNTGWDGKLTKFIVSSSPLGQWQLKQPVPITVQAELLRVEKLCLSRTNSQFCADLFWSQTKHHATLSGHDIPLELMNTWLPETLRVAGPIDFDGNINQQGDNAYIGKLRLTTKQPAVDISFPVIKEKIVFDASEININLDQKMLQAQVGVFLNDGGRLRGDISIPGWSVESPFNPGNPVRAYLKIDELPAQVLTNFIPDIVRAQGMIAADLKLSGTLSELQLQGSTDWQQGKVIVPELGISLQNIHVSLRSGQQNNLDYSITAKSGEGSLDINGKTKLSPKAGWPSEIRLRSQSLEVVNIPEAFILVDSDVKAIIEDKLITIEGEATVPTARLKPRELPEGTAGLSRDVIILSDDEQASAEENWQIKSRLRVKLGQQVVFNGFGVRGKLRGNLLVIDEPGKATIGQGELSIDEGFYRLRGQDLSIRRGKLLFADTFIDNPGIDVEAVRIVETVTAGVRLTGRLQEPELALFSEPPYPESTILSYIILGHAATSSSTSEDDAMRNNAAAMGLLAGDFLSEGIGGRLGLDEVRISVGDTSEKTALVMGKYLSPKLYIRYLSGIVESSSIVQLQYRLTDKIQLQTESGYRGSQSITGGDIFFTIEY